MTTTFEQAPQLRSLSKYAIDCLTSLNERDQKALTSLRSQRSAFEAEIASIDDVMKEIEDTIARRQAKTRGDLIRSLAVNQEDDPQTGDDPNPTAQETSLFFNGSETAPGGLS